MIAMPVSGGKSTSALSEEPVVGNLMANFSLSLSSMPVLAAQPPHPAPACWWVCHDAALPAGPAPASPGGHGLAPGGPLGGAAPARPARAAAAAGRRGMPSALRPSPAGRPGPPVGRPLACVG